MTSCEHHPDHGHAKTCRVCKSEYCHDCHPSAFGICERCGFKILIGLVVVMVIVSYTIWFGLLL